jgi:NADPH2 dehydrogenase
MAPLSPSVLFDPLPLGFIQLSHRIVMAPLTRFRTDDNNAPLPFVAEYYSQRACNPGTLIISEGAAVSRLAGSITHMPDFWSAAQIAAWKGVVSAVHAQGSYIFLQILGNGRTASLAERTKDGLDLIGASAIPIPQRPGEGGVVSPGYGQESHVPREATEDEIWQIVDDFALAAKNAVEQAGFDGVEINACNGHMIDQFIQDTTNRRTDAWGGSVENRSRFAVEIAKSVVAAVGKDKVGMRLSPWSEYLSMRMPDPVPQFSHLVGKLREVGLAYIHLIEPRIAGDVIVETGRSESNIPLLDAWGTERPAIVAGGYNSESARKILDVGGLYEGRNVAISFGRHFVSNPDLVFRVKEGVALTPYDRKTFYSVGIKEGYTDYGFSEEFKAKQREQV